LRQGWGRREAGSHDALVCHGLAATVVQRDDPYGPCLVSDSVVVLLIPVTTSDCCSQARTRFRRYTENKFNTRRAHQKTAPRSFNDGCLGLHAGTQGTPFGFWRNTVF
jgi:hypothetical protein